MTQTPLGILRISEVIRKACRPLIRDFHEIKTLQNSRNLISFFSGVMKRAEFNLVKDLKKLKLELGIQDEISVFPISGKNNFLRGIPNFAVSILLKKFGSPYVCVAECPMQDITFWAQDTKGAFCENLNGKIRLQVSQKSSSEFSSVFALLDSRCSSFCKKFSTFSVLGSDVLSAFYLSSSNADIMMLHTEEMNDNLLSLIKLLIKESGGEFKEVNKVHALFGGAKLLDHAYSLLQS